MRPRTIKHQICKVVGDGAMSHPKIGEARLIPAVIIDPVDNNSIPELLIYHQTTSPGDTKLTWSNLPFNKRVLVLNLEFIKPMEVSFGIEFDVMRDLNVIDGIIQSRALYLQCGKKGDKFSDLSAPKILVEVPFLGFDKKWNYMLLDALKRKYRKMNFTKSEASEATKRHIKTMRELYHRRRNN